MRLAAHLRSMAGRWLFRAWLLRARLFRTRRTLLVYVFRWVVAACGLLLILEGLMLGWFLSHFAPSSWDLTSIYGRAPWSKTGQWVAAVCLVAAGLLGLMGGLLLGSRGQAGSYLTMGLLLIMFGVGAVLLYCGIRFRGAWFTGAGAIDIAWALVVQVLLGLCWYTLDPLALHWDNELPEI